MDFHREIVRCSLFSKDCVNLGEGHYFCKIWMNTIFLSRNANFRMHRKIPLFTDIPHEHMIPVLPLAKNMTT